MCNAVDIVAISFRGAQNSTPCSIFVCIRHIGCDNKHMWSEEERERVGDLLIIQSTPFFFFKQTGESWKPLKLLCGHLKPQTTY